LVSFTGLYTRVAPRARGGPYAETSLVARCATAFLLHHIVPWLWVPAFAGTTNLRAGATHRPSWKQRAQGMPGTRRTHGPVCKEKKAHKLQATTGAPKHSGIPCAIILTLSFVLFRENGLCCLRHRRDAKHRRQLGVSIATPECSTRSNPPRKSSCDQVKNPATAASLLARARFWDRLRLRTKTDDQLDRRR
jgi:hypothetical protein